MLWEMDRWLDTYVKPMQPVVTTGPIVSSN